MTRKLELQGSFEDKGSGSGSGIFPDQDPGVPKRPDPDPQHWFIVPSGAAGCVYCSVADPVNFFLF